MQRTNDDTWDLATGVGTTATGVAAARALASTRPHRLIDDPFARPLVEALGIDYYVRMAHGDLAHLDDSAGAIDWNVMADGMAVRTHYFDEFFAAASASGIRQAVILASGLDTRGYRLPWPAGTTVFELDQPGVIDFKVAAMAELGAMPPVPLRGIGVDLRFDWPEALASNGFHADCQTVWIAEGLLGYLTPADQDRFLRIVTGLSAPGSMLAVDWQPDLAVATTERSRAVAAAERSRAGEAVVNDASDMIYLGDRAPVDRYLSDLGWSVTTVTAEQRCARDGIEFSADEAAAGLYAAHYSSAVLHHRQLPG